MSLLCNDDCFYDDTLRSCAPCKDFCVGIERHNEICNNKCKEYLSKSINSTKIDVSLNESQKLIIFICLGLALVLFITICAIVVYCLKRPRTRSADKSIKTNSSNPQESSTPLNPLKPYHPQSFNAMGQDLTTDLNHATSSSFILPGDSIAESQKMTGHVSRGASFQSGQSSMFNFMEDQQIGDLSSDPSELGSSLRSSVEPLSISLGGSEEKTFFQNVMKVLAKLPFFRSATLSNSTINIALQREEFILNQKYVMDRLHALGPDYEDDIRKVNITTV